MARKGILKELDTIYITSDGRRFLKEMDALCAEAQVQMARKSARIIREKRMKLIDILLSVLGENNWGIYYKSEPMQTLNMQNDSTLLKINEVDNDVVENAVTQSIEKLRTEELEKSLETHTVDRSPTDSNTNQS